MNLIKTRIFTTYAYRKMLLAAVSLFLFFYFPSCTSSEGKKLPLMKKGEILSVTEFTDQFDKKAVIPSDTRYLVFTADMKGSRLIRNIAESRGKAFLDEKKIAIVGDIHGMPAIIASTIALPKMKKYGYTMYLIRSSGTGEAFEKKADHATVYKLNNMVIESIDFAGTEESLLSMLQ